MKFTYSFYAKQILALLCFYLGFLQTVDATHAVGADLTYRCISNNNYEVFLRFYRDCGGTTAPSNPSISIAGSSGCSSVASTLALSLVSSQEVSQVCSGSSTSCSGGSIQGTQEYLYSAQVVLPSGCNFYTLSFELAARNAIITNLVNPGNADIYIETSINTALAPCNNSPEFNNIPVLYGCSNQQILFNHGSFDADGDSLSFSLINPKQGGGANIPFVSGLSPTYPLNLVSGTTFQFDSLNGQMTFTPLASTGQVAVISVLIEEFRNGQKIGSIVRDLQIIVLTNCNGSSSVVNSVSPSLGTINNNIIQFCGGGALSINFGISDADAADVLTATSDISSIIPGATVSVSGSNPINLQINIPTPTLSNGSYPFSITINDGGCPIPNVQIIGYSLVVNNNPPTVIINASVDSLCEGNPVTLTASGANTLTWDNGLTNGQPFVPSSSNTYTVVGTSNSCSDTASVAIVVKPKPILNINASNNSICLGESVSLTATGASIYAWNNNISNAIPFSPLSSSSYTVVGTADGCSDSASINIAVNAYPTVQIIAADTTICSGNAVNLTAIGANSYNWSTGLANGANYIPTTSGTLSVVGTSNGCSDTASILINVNASPSVIINSSATSLCIGDSLTLVVSGTAANYTWNNGVSNATPFAPGITTTYTATGVANNGCISTNQTTIIVNSLPNVTANSSQSILCQGEQVSLTGGGALNYSWNNGVSNGVPFSPNSSATYQVEGTDINGCRDTASVTVSYFNTPPPAASINTSSNQLCPGTTALLTGSLASGETIEWFRNGNLIAGANAAIYSTNLAGTYYNRVTNSNGCTTSSSTETISTLSLPNSAGNIAGITTLCYGEQENYSISTVGSASSYNWSIIPSNAASISVGQGSNTVKVNCQNIDFQLRVTPINSCGTGGSSTINVDMDNSFPCDDISFAANISNICEGETIVYSNYSNPNAVVGLTANWTFGSGASPATAVGNGPHTVTYNSPGLKTVRLDYVDFFGNVIFSKSYADYINVLNIASCSQVSIQLTKSTNIECYPNPTEDRVQINIENPKSGTIEITNLQGVQLHKDAFENKQNFDLSFKEFPTGLYLISIKTRHKSYISKVLKTN